MKNFYKRGNRYTFEIQVDGKKIKKSLGRVNATQARHKARRWTNEIHNGNLTPWADHQDETKSSLTIGQAVVDFLSYFHDLVALGKRSPKTVSEYQKNLETVVDYFGQDRPLDQITTVELQAYRKTRQGSPVAFNREAAAVSSMISWVSSPNSGHDFTAQNPVKHLETYSENWHDVNFTDEQIDAFYEAAADHIVVPCKLAEETGLRLHSQVRNLKKSDVNVQLRKIVGQGCYAKNGERIPVMVTVDLMEKIKAEMDRSESEWVFTKDDGVTQLGSIRTAFKAAARRAEIPELRPHDLRHLFAKRYAEDPEVSVSDLMDLGGWKSPAMVKRYVGNMSDDRRRRIIDRAAANRTSRVVSINRKQKIA